MSTQARPTVEQMEAAAARLAPYGVQRPYDAYLTVYEVGRIIGQLEDRVAVLEARLAPLEFAARLKEGVEQW